MEQEIEIRLGQLLVGKRLSLATAESCTGGNIAHLITSVAGSSVYYKGGFVTYSNEAKCEFLGVLESDIEKFGAVSEPVVRQMAIGAKKRMNSDCAIATTGIAGPGGGTPQKPVGTVWIGIATPTTVFTQCFHFGSERAENINVASTTAMEMLYHYLTE